MAEDFQFADNHRDLCIPSGTGAGFQFEFYCQCCNDTWRSPFEAFRSGQVSGWLSQAQGVLGSLFGNTGYALGSAAAAEAGRQARAATRPPAGGGGREDATGLPGRPCGDTQRCPFLSGLRPGGHTIVKELRAIC